MLVLLQSKLLVFEHPLIEDVESESRVLCLIGKPHDVIGRSGRHGDQSLQQFACPLLGRRIADDEVGSIETSQSDRLAEKHETPFGQIESLAEWDGLFILSKGELLIIDQVHRHAKGLHGILQAEDRKSDRGLGRIDQRSADLSFVIELQFEAQGPDDPLTDPAGLHHLYLILNIFVRTHEQQILQIALT